jgi:RHS repeat-associated protein
MRQTKPVSFLDTFLCTFFAVFMAIPNVVWADALTQVSIVPTPVPAAPPGTPLTFKLEVRSTTNGVACLVQTGTSLTSTNPADWHTLLSVQPSPTNTVTIPGFQATNQTAFFRLAEFLAQTDTNSPAWSNGVGGRFTFQQVSNLWAQWNAASDNFGVASYRVYLGTNLVTNVLGNTLSCILPINPRQRADIRIQAVDASDNATELLSLAYLPGDKLLAVSDDNGRVYLFHFREDGTFSAAREIANFGALDRGVSLGDFDRDGILDLIAGHASGQSLFPSFFKGRGDGTFAAGVALPTAPGANSYMMGATVGDFDCDGNLDFAVTGHGQYVFFYWGRGDGTFTLETKDWGAYGIGLAAGDFNEDGREDVVRTTYSDGYVRLFLSNGDRSFTETNRVGDAGSEPYGPVVGDFDEDGHLDIITCGDGSGDITFFKGHGDGTFTNLGVNGVRSNLDPNNYGAMSAFDYNEDGHLDLVLVNYTGHAAYFFAGNGDGTFKTNLVPFATGLGNTLGVASPPLPPRVEVAISPTDPITNLNQALPFQATGSGTTTNDLFRWTFGDQGTNPLAWTFTTNLTNMGQTIAHTYTNEGRFVTRLLHTTTNSTTTNAINSARGTWVTILGQPPVANAGGPYLLGEQAATQRVWTATLDGSASYDDFGITNYFWTFGDGTFLNNGPVVSHSWSNQGVWNVGLTVADNVGQTGSNQTTVTFTPGAPPVAAITGPSLLDETFASAGVWRATFSGANSTDDRGIWKYDWNFGNSTTGTGSSAQGAFSAIGNYVVTLTVTDHAGQTNSTTHAVTVQADAPPVAVITAPGLLDETAASNGVWRGTFSGASSTDDHGLWKYDWNFGNGTTGSGSPAQGAFTAAGTYTVTLTVTDNAGQTAATNCTVQVKANGLPMSVITGPRLITEATATNSRWFGTWNGLASTDDRGIYRYDWNFGDNTTGSGATILHGYPAPGLYQIVLTVTDFGNQTATSTESVAVIAGKLPQPQIVASSTNPEGTYPVTISGLGTTDDRGVASFRWTLPPRKFTFDGQYLDQTQWRTANTRQEEKLIVTGQGSWGTAYFFSPNVRLQRGASIEGRVDTSSGSSDAMVGFKDPSNTSGDHNQLIYSLRFNNGAVSVYEKGNDSGPVTNYTRGSSYDFRIETKPGTGARYFLRPSDQGQAFVLVADTANYNDPTFGFGADVYSGAFAFDDLTVDGIYISTWDFTTGFSPGGPVTLEVVDHAGQTNTATLAINPITGTPPVALIVGSTNAPAGVELAYHGYFSTDDHGIASYTWDFGDGSPLAFGPAVSHAYTVPGIYTNTLTVRDYAGQPGVTTALIFVGSGNQLVCVPWRIIGGVEYPHETYAGKTNTLKAVAKGVPVPFDYIWDFGDGSAPVTNTVSTTTAAYGLEASHAYSGADGTPFNATIRVALTNGSVLMDTYPILLRPKSLDTEMSVAIDEGLWSMHKTQNRYDLNTNNKAGDWTDNGPYGGYKISPTASAVQAFAINGHLMTDDASNDPYAETVQRGVNYLLTVLSTRNIGPQTYGDPDANHNGFGLSGDTGRPIYETGQLMDAIVAAGRPELVAPVGPANVRGRTFKDLMQDMVDMYSWGQSDYTSSYGGGWQYDWNSQGNDNSASQWSAIGFLTAERVWGLPVPDWVKERNLVWIAASKGGTGFGYTGAGDGEATTPSAMVQLAFDGVPTTNALWIHGENYLATDWQNIMNRNNLYAQYAIAKALRTANPQVHNLSLTGLDWFRDPTKGLARTTIDRQRADGSWLSASWVGGPISTPWSIIILSSSIFRVGPVAVAQARPNPTAVGFPVVFDGRGSFHQHPAGRVTEYRWDFDASNGLDFDHPDAYGPVVTNRFGFTTNYTITLQVRDNSTPQLNDTASIEVFTTIPPYPPTADAGGPYLACVGQDVHLDGSGSFDVDGASGDYIQAWDWEVRGGAPYDFNDGVTGAHAVITNGYPTAGHYDVGLRVKDATSIVFPTLLKPDLTNVNFTTVFVFNRVITNLFGRAKDNKIQLVWNPAGDYAVVTRSTAGPDRGFTEIGRTTNTYATYLDTDVDYNVPYYYRIYAYQNGQAAPLGLSDPVNVVSTPRSFENCGPYFTATPPHEASVGQLYEVYLQAKERQNNPFSYVMLAGPTNMTLNTTNGLVSYQPAQADLGEQFVSFAATNFCGTNTLSYTLTVFNLTNLPPIVNIHGPYAGVAGQPVQFSSAGTFDPDTNSLTYAWAFGDGTVDTNANPTHAYPAEGTYNVSLYVNDGHGGTTTARTTADIVRANRIPIADAGHTLMPLVGQIVRLDGSSSWDADLDPLNYRWEVVMRPTNSTSTLANATTARPSLLIDRPGFFVVQLIVNDGRADSTPDGVTLITANSPPIANAGRDQRVLEGNTATLDGTGSHDVDLQPLTYRWLLTSKPDGSTATLTNSNTAHPTFGVDLYGLYQAELIVNDGLVDSAPDRVIVTTGNLLPVIVSAPAGTNAVFDYLWAYAVRAYDLDGTNLTFTLVQAPNGMTLTPQPPVTEPGETNSALIAWTPTRAQEGTHPVRIRVTDAEGATVEQAFTLVVSRDIEPPQVVVALIAGEVNQYGQWAARLGTTPQFRVLATDNIGVTNKTLSVASRPVVLDANGIGSVTATNAGLWQVFATATDAEGNVGTTNTSILFYDPNATNTIFAQILSPINFQTVTKPVPVIGTITNATDLFSYRVDFARAADVDLDYISVEGPQFTTITNVVLPPGTRSLTNAVLAQFDPTMLLNDDYVIRLVASDGRSLWYEPAIVSVSGNLKFGEFHLDFTDLAVPVAGVPITITRSYDTRESTRQGDFGYGWSLGVQDAKIRKTLRNGTMFVGSRVYINTPDGRRVGFTANYQPSSWLFTWIGYVLLQPDAGVYEKLDIEGNTVIYLGGSFYGGLGDQNYNPSNFRLTTKDGTVYSYHDTQGLQNVRDLNGNQLVLNRDGVYHFSAGSSTPDQQVQFIRDAQGRITEIIDPAKKRLTYAYDDKGDLRSFTDQVTNVTQYLYSTARAHYLTNIIDPLGHSALRLEYDSAGRLVGIRDALGNLTSQDFPDPNTAVFKDANGHTNIVRYDDNGNETMKAIPGISTNYFAFDANNNEIWRQDARGFVTTRAYDVRGNLTNLVDALSNVTAIAYNDLNKPTSVKDASGQTTQFHYNSQGQLTNVVNALGGQSAFTRDSQGRVTSVTDFNSRTTTYDYAGGCSCGKPGRVINPDGTLRTYEYNAQGKTVRETDELGYSTFSYFDDAGRLLWGRDAMSNTTTYTYAGSLKISETDPMGRTTWYCYDTANRQIAITNAMGGVTRFEYDKGTNRTAVIDPLGNVTRFQYDAANRLTHQIDPWGRTNVFAYDAAGNRTEAVDRNGRKRTFGYDAQNRRTNELWWEGTNVVRSIEFTFNALGIMTSASDPASHLAFGLDTLNRLKTAAQTGVTKLTDFTLTYGYDGMANVTSVMDNWGAEVLSQYDSRNQLTNRVWQGGGLPGASLHFDYDAAGNRTNILRYADAAGTVPAGQNQYRFSPARTISDILHASGVGATLAEYRYQRNTAQEIIGRTANAQQSTFNYDLTGQLTNALYSAGQPNEDYRYDANGNRIGGGYMVTTNNQIVADRTNAYSYDMEGSMVGRSNTATHATTAYRYDHRNRLVSVVDMDAGGTVTQTVEFTYDPLNRRIAKRVNGTATYFLLNRENIWADANSTGDIIARYLLGNRIDEMLARHRLGEPTIWYLTDNLGTVRDLTDSAGNLVSHAQFDTFGRVITQSEAAFADRFLFTGREWDAELGLFFCRARYYSPDLGRFTCEDPTGFDARDFNLYRYVQNSPLGSSDPTGESVIIEFAISMARITAVANLWGAITCDIWIEYVRKKPGREPIQYVERYAKYFAGGYLAGFVAGAFMRAAAMLTFVPWGPSSFAGGAGADASGLTTVVLSAWYSCE